MKHPLAAVLLAAALPFSAGDSFASPLSHSHAVSNTDVGTVQQIQYRYRNDGPYNDGPYVAVPYNDAYAYGAAPSYGDGYYAYGAAPGYAAPRRWGYGAEAPSPGSSSRCSSDRDNNSSFPSWMCR
jgi:hypothetical protein